MYSHVSIASQLTLIVVCNAFIVFIASIHVYAKRTVHISLTVRIEVCILHLIVMSSQTIATRATMHLLEETFEE